MKKIFRSLGLALVLILIFTTSCTPRAIRKPKKTKDTSLARVLVKKELLVGMEDGFPPFAFRDDTTGELVGFDVDISKAICKVLFLEPAFKVIDWSQKDYLLGTRSIDCIINGFSYSESRATAFTLSKPYVRTAQVLVVMEDSPCENIEDIGTKAIGVQTASSMLSTIRTASMKYGGLSMLQTFPSTEDALVALENGDIEAVANDVLVMNHIMNTENKPYRIIPQALNADEYVVAFKKGDIALKNKIEEALLLLAENGTLEAISKKWFGSNITVIGR